MLGARSKHEFMIAHQGTHRVAVMSRVLSVSRSGYYAWRKRGPSQRAVADAELTEQIRAIHACSRGTYGSPRIHAELREHDVRVGRKRIARLMASAGIEGVSPRKKKVKTTVQDKAAAAVPDLVKREFTAEAPDQLWVADITYVPTRTGFLYLAIVLDVFSRRVVGWAMATHMRTELVEEALDMAITQRQPPVGVVHHSDRGSQYTSIAFGARAAAAGMRLSMGRVGSAYDNAMAESFFGTLECELIERTSFESPRQASLEVFDFIEGFYNPHRRHSSIGDISPNEFERRHRVNAERNARSDDHPIEGAAAVIGSDPAAQRTAFSRVAAGDKAPHSCREPQGGGVEKPRALAAARRAPPSARRGGLRPPRTLDNEQEKNRPKNQEGRKP